MATKQVSRARLVLMAAGFVGLTIAGMIWAVTANGLKFADLGGLSAISRSWALVIAGGVLALYLADICRYQVYGWLVGRRVTFLQALEASVACDFFSWITPGAAFGAPAAVYTLARRGIPAEDATIIAFGKSMVGSAVLIILVFACLSSDLCPPLPAAISYLLLWGTGVIAVVLLVPVVAVAQRARAGALIARGYAGLDGRSSRAAAGARVLLSTLEKVIVRLDGLALGGGIRLWAAIGIHLPFFAVFAGILCACCLALGAPSATTAMALSLVYLGFLYVAPTPGAAGLSEITAVTFFGSQLGAGAAVTVVLFFRAITLYLHLLVGLIYLIGVGMEGLIAQRVPDEPLRKDDRT